MLWARRLALAAVLSCVAVLCLATSVMAAPVVVHPTVNDIQGYWEVRWAGFVQDIETGIKYRRSGSFSWMIEAYDDDEVNVSQLYDDHGWDFAFRAHYVACKLFWGKADQNDSAIVACQSETAYADIKGKAGRQGWGTMTMKGEFLYYHYTTPMTYFHFRDLFADPMPEGTNYHLESIKFSARRIGPLE